ncbi:MBOAT family O-acyltransferase [Rheinheimera sp.]|uniref:MBOAT family O-acyltransferase n=1 Tax=Rheinheimera sp. TaxID=1869214 RepID=UPI002FDD24A5
MIFQSFHFVVFFLLLLWAGYLLRHRHQWRNLLLLFASYYFYMSWDWRFAALLMLATLSNFYAGRFICRASQLRVRRFALFATVIVNLAVLATFKYLDFFIVSLAQFMSVLGIQADLPLMDLLLPIGISFFTFQSLSYSIDCYRGKITECKSFNNFALFVSFFPTLLSGPITRASMLLPQISDSRKQYQEPAEQGLVLVCRGLIKKIIFADQLALHLVNPAFDNPSAYSSGFLLLAVYAYSLQIYMDLSAYTDIARGLAQLLGFRLPENFNQPYKADSVSNFWQRWHMSMSGFFRDYLYFSLGGSQYGYVYLNLMITFVLIGLWHGAGWNFILYGFLHGSVVCIERYFRNRRKLLGLPPLAEHGFGYLCRIFLVFQFVALSRILFRAEDLSAAWLYLTAVSQNLNMPSTTISLWPLVILAVAVQLHYVKPALSIKAINWCAKKPLWLQSGAFAALLGILYSLVTGTPAFVYFQF